MTSSHSAGRESGWRHTLGVFCLYAVLAAVYTWPLVAHLGSLFPSDAGDPALNTSILWWNARVRPFSSAWWNAPHYYPTPGVAAFTENLVGLSVVASPVFWLTGNPIAAHNVVYFLTWPLSGLAVYLLVRFLTGNTAAAFVSGAAFAFTPYRTAEIAHVQSLAAYGLPLVLLGLHGYLHDGRRRWLLLFASAWLLQSLSNGYYMLFGGVLVGVWIAYFACRAGQWHRVPYMLGAWVAGSVPLAFVMWRYAQIHAAFGLTRSAAEIAAFSATPESWLQVTGDVWLWRRVLPAGNENLFPGVVALAIATAGVVRALRSRTSPGAGPSARVRTAARVSLVIAAASLAVALFTIAHGPWTGSLLGIAIRTREWSRPMLIGIVAGAVALWLSPRIRRAVADRSPLAFYGLAVALVAVLCCGPAIRYRQVTLLDHAPYGWLMHLPGFDGLRVVPRFWMLGVLCLAVAAGIALARLLPASRTRWAIAALLVIALYADGAMPAMRMASPAPLWSDVEPATRAQALVELPIGGGADWNATYRAAAHQRRVVNGVSGYDPPHYVALKTALDERNPQAVVALASLGPIDVVVDRGADPGGAIERFVASAPGVSLVESAGDRVVFTVAAGVGEPILGPALPAAAVRAYRHAEILSSTDKSAPMLTDGDVDTTWSDFPQTGGQWIDVDLGGTREVGGVICTLGRSYLAFPRRLRVETSLDATTWSTAWEGSGAVAAFLAMVRAPLVGDMRVGFEPRAARYVRLSQTADAAVEWRLADVSVRAPASR